jgi:hypothetical protein
MPSPQLGSAKSAVENAIEAYNEGSDFIRQEQDDQTNDVITFDPDDLADEAEFRTFLGQLEASLAGPTEIGIEDPIKVDLTKFFDEPYIHLRDYLPDITDDNQIISYTFPDPTLSGIFPDFGQEDWSDWLALAEFDRTMVFSDYRYFHHDGSEEYLMLAIAQVSEDTHNVYVQNIPNAGVDVQLQRLPGWDDFFPYFYVVGLYSPMPGPDYEGIAYRFYVDENDNGSLDSGESTKTYSTIGSIENLGVVQEVTVSGDIHPNITWKPTPQGAEDFYMVRIFPVDAGGNPDLTDLLFQSYYISKSYQSIYNYTYWGNLFEAYETLAICVVAFDLDTQYRVINQSRYCINH